MKDFASMDDILEKFTHIRLATEEDNAEILEFYNNESMQTGEESISFARTPDFFNFYKLSSKKYWLFIFLNKDQSIGGVGGVLRHERFVNGKLKPLAYFCDLRISNNASRIAKVQWRKFFPEIINILPKLGPDEYCESAYTAILADNEAAINSLTKGGRGITYRFLGKYHVHSYINTGFLKSKKFYAQDISQDEFLRFYKTENSEKFLCEDPIQTIKEISKYSTPVSFVGVFHQGKIIAALKPVLKNQTRRIKIQNMSKSKVMATNGLKLLGRPTPSKQGELSILDLSFLSYSSHLELEDKKLVLEAIQLWIERNKLLKDIHIINMTDTSDIIPSSPLERGINFVTPGHLYEIHPEEQSGILPTSQFRFEGAFL